MRTSLLVSALILAVASEATAQDATPIACKSSTCVFKLDWGGNKSSGDYPPDKRYGSGDDFEQRFRNALRERGLRFSDTPIEGAITMVARPTMQGRVMCDAMAGINPDRTCTAMIALAISFTSPPGGPKAPGAIRISNRCAAGDIFLSHKEFGQYSADMIWFQLAGQAAKADRPRVNC
jgi:hypothetical protein